MYVYGIILVQTFPTKYDRQLKQTTFVFQVLETRKSRVNELCYIQFILRALFLAFRLPLSYYILMWQGKEAVVSLPLFIMALIPLWGIHPHELI